MDKQDSQTVASSILSMGEEAMSEVIGHLVANEMFVQVMQSTFQSSLAAKNRVGQSLESLVSSLNLPSLEDVQQVSERLDEVEDFLDAIEERLGHLAAVLERQQAGDVSPSPSKKKRPKKKKATRQSAPDES